MVKTGTSRFTFGGQAYEGDIDEYIDKDLVRRNFKITKVNYEF